MSTRHRNARVPLWPIDLVGVVACVALTLTAYATIVRPIADERRSVASTRAELGRARLEAGELDGRQSSLREHLEQTRTELEASSVRLEPTDQLNLRLARILEHAAATGLIINETQSSAVRRGDRFDTIPLDLSGHGSYRDCADFLHRVCTRLPDVEVVGVRLQAHPTSNAPPTFRFQLAWYAATSVVAAPTAP